MSGKITEFLREYVFGLSIITTVVGLFVLIIGILGMWFQDAAVDVFNLPKGFMAWSIYVLIVGLIILGFGLYYLYSFITKRKFLLEEIKIDKRSELIKKHNELKRSVRHLPSKYAEMLKEKEKELGVK